MHHLSQTAMGMYDRCPQMWKLQYIDRHPTKPNRFLNLGSAVHAALEAFYQGRLSEPGTVEEMIAAFEAEIEPTAYANGEELATARADGLQMIRAFHATHAPEFKPALLVEGVLRFELDGIPVLGKIDRVDKLDGTVRIVDYKSGFRPPRLDEVRQSDQLTLYQVAVERALGLEVAAVGLYHVPSQTLFEVPAHGPERVEALRRRVLRVARGIEQAEFEPRPGRHCSWCDVKEWCPAWAHEYPENWEQTPLPPTPTHAEASHLADRFGEIKDQIRDLQSDLAAVRAPLEQFFRITGERVAAGDRYAVRATPCLGHRFDAAALRALLEPAGLWEKVLAPDWRAEESLLADPDVPADIRARMERLAEVEHGWTFRYGPAAPTQADSPRSGHGKE